MFHMHLRKEPFELIKSGKKKIELRLYDSTRKKVKIGDLIEFEYDDHKILTRVMNLYRASDFKELYQMLALEEEIYGLSEAMLAYYTLEQQKQIGVIGMEIKQVYKVGIDIGGTNVRCAIFDTDMNMVDVYKVRNDRNKTASENLKPVVDFILKHEVSGIGIGAPGPLDARKGKILNPPNLVGWDNFEIVKFFEENCKVSCKLTNDANAAALAEARLGNGQGVESMYYITMSTGFGGGYVFRNELINGISTNVGEIYNMIVNEDPHHHKGVNAGSLNEQCGGYGLSVIANERYGKEISAKELFDLYYANDPIAIEIIEHAIDTAAKGIANVGCVIDPELYVVGGSIAFKNPFFVERIFNKAKDYYIAPEYLKYRIAKFEDDAGLIGAALLND